MLVLIKNDKKVIFLKYDKIGKNDRDESPDFTGSILAWFYSFQWIFK